MAFVRTACNEGEDCGCVRIVGLSPGGYRHSEDVDGMAKQKNNAETGLNSVIFKMRVRKVWLISGSHYFSV